MKKDCDMNIMIDKLKLCYKVKQESFINVLRETPNIERDWTNVGFSLRKRSSGKHYDFIYEIWYMDYADKTCTTMEEQMFGTICFGLRMDKDEAFEDYVWLHVENKQFYLPYNWEVGNRTIYIEYITEYLQLEFNNITSFDLAVDSDVNYSKKIIRLLRTECLIPIVNGSKITDREKLIEEILYIGVGNLKRIKEYTLQIGQKKALKDRSSGLMLVAYNKKREIENHSHKEYIIELHDNPKRLYRLEVRINSDSMKAFLRGEEICFSPNLLFNNDFLWYVFLTFLNRIIRFQAVRGRKVFGVMDLI